MISFEREMQFAYLIFGYLHKTNTIVFSIMPTVSQAKVHLSCGIITNVSCCGCVIYSSIDAMYITRITNSIAKKATSADYYARKTQYISLNDKEYGENKGIVLWRYQVYVMQIAFFIGTNSSPCIYEVHEIWGSSLILVI